MYKINFPTEMKPKDLDDLNLICIEYILLKY